LVFLIIFPLKQKSREEPALIIRLGLWIRLWLGNWIWDGQVWKLRERLDVVLVLEGSKLLTDVGLGGVYWRLGE